MIYRSPSVPQATLLTLLTRLLTHVTLCTAPCVILGDFNEDVLHCQNSAIMSLMSSFSFTQIVSYPTTPQATLIDHVYLRNTTYLLLLNYKTHTTLTMTLYTAAFHCEHISITSIFSYIRDNKPSKPMRPT